MKVEVQHLKADGAGWEPVARVTIPERTENGHPFDDVLAIEYAWRWTNNVGGSWSRMHPRNVAWNPNVEVLKPLKVLHNFTQRHRSSMVGDRLILDDGTHKRVFEVSEFGCIQVAP